jgi:uncharacterized protein YkwD
MPVRSSLLRLLAVLVTALLAVPAAASAAPARPAAKAAKAAKRWTAQAASACPGADLDPSPADLPALNTAILCLHNQIRAAHGLPLLRENLKLRRAAAGHSADMVAHGYFDHTTPSGASFVDRILGARYVGKDDGWVLGENLAWGEGSYGTPRGIVEAWMASPEHRANILKRAYREVGLGIALGVPSDHGAGATYTADFGVRR